MKPRYNPFLLVSTVFSFAAATHAADFTWDGGTGNWTDTNWNGATASGPVTAGNTATINSGNVTANVGGPGNLDSITLGSGAQLNLSNSAYNYFDNLVLQGGTVSGSGNYNAYGAAIFGDITVGGTAASTIAGSSFFNLSSTSTFTVADATGDSNTDLLVTTSLRGPTGNPDFTYNTAKLIKEGTGTMEVTVHSYFRGGLDLNAGALKLSGGNDGYGFFDGTVNVNSGTTLSMTSDGTGFGYRNDWKPDAVNINGGTVNGGGNHIWGISGGVNMTGGTLDSSGGFQWNYTNLNTLASADTATVSGPLNLRGDGGYTTMAVDVADGAAATDLLISGNVSGAFMSITKSGAGTMELSGANSYSGNTTVNGGTLVLSGSSLSSNIIVNATGSLSLSSPAVDDAANVVVASGGQVALNFSGSDTVGSLEIDGSGPLPAGLYDATDPTYGSYFSGTGSLMVLAESGTWTALADGNWSDGANWASSTVATGYDNTATFNAATGVTVTLDTNRVIGNLAFSVSDYILAGATTLTLQAASNPTISVASGRIATISANLGGTGGMEKTGAGALLLSGVKSYTGGTTVTAGTLELSANVFDQAAVNGSVTVNSGATLKLSGNDFSGLGRIGSRVSSLTVDSGTVQNTINSFVANATVDLTAATMSGGTYHVINTGFNSFESATTSTISSNLLIRVDYGSSNLNLNVADGDAATDLLISGNVGSVLTAGINKNGSGKLVLSGTNTYTGNTVVSDGELVLADNAQLSFVVNDAPASNMVTGSGAATFAGDFVINTAAVTGNTGLIWTLVDRDTLTGESFDSTFSVVGFTDANDDGIWIMSDAKGDWSFDEASGELSLDVGNDYDDWATANGVTGGETDDDDADGLTNFEEYAFGTDPTGGSSANPIVAPLDKATGTFSYTRRATPATTGLTYTVWTSTDLGTWTQDSGAIQGTPTVSGEVETVPVTISPALLSNSKLFIQVRAD